MITYGQVESNALFTFIVDQNTSISRIDQYISSLFPHYSRSFFQQLILEKHVSLNGKIITKPSTQIALNDIITVQFPSARTIESDMIKHHTTGVNVVASHDHFMIIYKPANLLVHPPSNKSTAVTLTDWIIQNHQELVNVGIVDRPGIVHRLDKDTSGIMILTRTNYGHTVFNNLFKQRDIKKTYFAVVVGHPEPQGTITLAIGRDPHNRIKMTTFDEENHEELIKKYSIKIRHAFTEYKVVHYFKDTSLVEVKPTTGRTHQIRVHMAAVGHPIIGDQTYGNASSLINRQALHAHSLSFTFDGTDYTFSYDMPEDMQSLIKNL